jgi:hypothetical protein
MKQYSHHIKTGDGAANTQAWKIITTGMISGDRRSNWKIVSLKKLEMIFCIHLWFK